MLRKWDANLLPSSQVDYGTAVLGKLSWYQFVWFLPPRSPKLPWDPRLPVVHLVVEQLGQTLQSFMFASIFILPIEYQPPSSQNWVSLATIHLIRNREHLFNSRILWVSLVSLLIREGVPDTEGIVTNGCCEDISCQSILTRVAIFLKIHFINQASASKHHNRPTNFVSTLADAGPQDVRSFIFNHFFGEAEGCGCLALAELFRWLLSGRQRLLGCCWVRLGETRVFRKKA